MSAKRILWVEDDDPDRFLAEQLVMQNAGWEVEWASSLLAAAERLRQDPFDAVVIDQMFPVRGPDEGEGEVRIPDQEIWSGCRLLYWLRSGTQPDQAPLEEEAKRLVEIEPLASNRQVRVCPLTSFRHDVVERAMREASEQDRRLTFVYKPVKIDQLKGFLEAAR